MTDPDHVTLDDLSNADEVIALIEHRVADIEAVLSLARQDLSNARQHQHYLVARYRAQAARPLAEWDGRGVIRRP